MSRSKHQTVAGVFGGKSASEIDAMIRENDVDVEALAAKNRMKKEQREERAQRSLFGKDAKGS
jgi:hypothetical protein